VVLHGIHQILGNWADAATGEEFSARRGEVGDLADELSTVVEHLVAALLHEHGALTTTGVETVEVPASLRAARDRIESERRADQ
jgi:hypothetical protein